MDLILALAIALTQTGAAGTADREVIRELTRIEQQLAATWKEGKCAAWGALVSPDWSVTHITGAVMTKAEALQTCTESSVPIETLEIDDISVRSYGDTAVVRGRTRVITGGTSPGQVTLRFTDVFVRRAGRWQVVASHATRLGS